jgi:hypothetical protein
MGRLPYHTGGADMRIVGSNGPSSSPELPLQLTEGHFPAENREAVRVPLLTGMPVRIACARLLPWHNLHPRDVFCAGWFAGGCFHICFDPLRGGSATFYHYASLVHL